jgi:hypothetical protein
MKLPVQDVELLTKAAKAVGFEIIGFAPGGLAVLDDGCLWNPLDDDGEALRLAVAAKLSADFFEDVILVGYTPNSNDCDQVSELTGNDAFAATRRAIVRAAAECAPN